MIDQLPLTDTTWGIDRYIYSPTCGQVVTPVVYLWQRPGAAATKENLTGAVKHGSPVTVTNIKQYEGAVWFFVKQDVKANGKTYPQRGWCKAQFLLNLGERLVNWGESLPVMPRHEALATVKRVAAASPFQHTPKGLA